MCEVICEALTEFWNAEIRQNKIDHLFSAREPKCQCGMRDFYFILFFISHPIKKVNAQKKITHILINNNIWYNNIMLDHLHYPKIYQIQAE